MRGLFGVQTASESQKTFLLKEPAFQKSEYEVHQVGPKDAENKKFSFLSLDTAELASI
jgi:hypothetical protein